jgi:hypothetical protein
MTCLVQSRRKERLDFGLLLEDETREQRHDLLWFIGRQGILKDELRKNELIGRIDLRSTSEKRQPSLTRNMHDSRSPRTRLGL